MPESPNYYAIIPADVRYATDIPPNAKLLFGEITALSNKHGYCFATNKYFADLYGVDVATISRWVSSLADAHFIRVEVDAKQGNSRKIFIQITVGGIDEKINTYTQNSQEGIRKKIKTYNNTINSTSKEEDICRVVFDAWSQVMKRPKAKYDLKRKKRIQARLSEGFTVEDLKQVPYGAAKSAWHMGENPTNTKYDDIDTIYRDATQVEKFLALARNGHGNQSEGCDICRNHPNRSHISLKTYGWIFNTETKQLEDCICKNGTA